jgi:hypothetical protein
MMQSMLAAMSRQQAARIADDNAMRLMRFMPLFIRPKRRRSFWTGLGLPSGAPPMAPAAREPAAVQSLTLANDRIGIHAY